MATVSTISISGRMRHMLLPVLHVMVLACAVALIAYITYDTLINVSFVTNPRYLEVQLWICLFFQFEILMEWILSPRKWHFFLRNAVFILVCIPYLTIIHHYHLDISSEGEYLLRFVPMVRAAYVIAIMWGVMSKNWISSMFGGYIIVLVATLYFLSLMFFVEEHPVNPHVSDYWQSLWYSVMQMTTCGSDINPVTPTGKAIGVILSAEGLILFPVFTVYFTHAFARTRISSDTRHTTPAKDRSAIKNG